MREAASARSAVTNFGVQPNHRPSGAWGAGWSPALQDMTSSQASPQGPSTGQPAVPTAPLARIDPETRRAKLALAIQREVMAGGRVESQTDFTAVIRYGRPVNNVLHLLLTLLTFGVLDLRVAPRGHHGCRV